MTAEADFVRRQFVESIPKPPPESVVRWAEENVRLVGSARSEAYRGDITPWTKEPIECANNGTRRMTLVLPIQSGKTSAGEIGILFWLAHWPGGDVQNNWPNLEQAKDRWDKHTEKKLRACTPVMARASGNIIWADGKIIFPHCNFILQGVNSDRALTSDSIRGQVNEEIHDDQCWVPGRLEQAWGRTTAFWNSVIFNISNASRAGTELHRAFLSGTQQHWEVKCPGCGKYHIMRTRWESSKPELGGLRYDMDGCRMPNGDVNYDRLRSSVRFQMPCGHVVFDNPSERRALSLSGRYSRPHNQGAPATDRSYTMEAVAIDYIPWLGLIRQKHMALRALKLGDPRPWWVYLRERECVFADPSSDRPMVQNVQRIEQVKSRDGIKNRVARFASLDYQQGTLEAGELPHWWLLIQDIAIEGGIRFQTVWEGKCLTDEDAVGTINDHGINPLCVVADSSFRSSVIYRFCLKHGYNCIKIAGRAGGSPVTRYFKHDDGSERIYSTPKPLHEILGLPPSKKTEEEEPEFWHISLFGALDRLHFIRNSADIKWEVPADASTEFMEHMESWEMQDKKVARTQETVQRWVQVKKRDDLLWCAACISVQAEMAEIIGATAVTYLENENEAVEKPDGV